MRNSKKTTAKKIVFISHINEESELAKLIKKTIDESFLDMIEVYVSTDNTSNTLGDKWLNKLTEKLKNCVVEIILCSPKSITRTWVNFEAGAGWIRDIPVIPLCHSGMTPGQLPMPLNMLQSSLINNVENLQGVFKILADSIGATQPSIDYIELIKKIASLELKFIPTPPVNVVAVEHTLGMESLIHKKRFELIENIRTYIGNPKCTLQQFKQTVYYSQLKPLLTTHTLRLVDGAAQSALMSIEDNFSSYNGSMSRWQRLILDDLAKKEVEWGLI